MQRLNPRESYRQVTALTAPPEQLVLMLYDGAINFLEVGLTGFNHTDPGQRNQTINNNVLRAQAIIFEMNSRLDIEKGGEIAENLRLLYNYFYSRLQEGNMKKRQAPIEEVTRLLRGVRDTWAEMLHRGQPADSNASAEAGLSLA